MQTGETAQVSATTVPTTQYEFFEGPFWWTRESDELAAKTPRLGNPYKIEGKAVKILTKDGIASYVVLGALLNRRDKVDVLQIVKKNVHREQIKWTVKQPPRNGSDVLVHEEEPDPKYEAWLQKEAEEIVAKEKHKGKVKVF